MPDPADRAADRLNKWLDAEGHAPAGDDLAAFANRVMREAALPESTSPDLSDEQRDRIRAQVFGGTQERSKARTSMTTHAFSANGTAPMELSIQPSDRSSASGFSILMTAAVIALIGIASFGLFRGSLDFLPGGSDPSPTDAPGIAYSPEASPAATASCDGSQWINVFDGTVPDLLADTPHVTLAEGTLIWHCSESSEELATGISDAGTTNAPGIIAMVTDEDTVRLLNLTNGADIELDTPAMITEDGELDYRSGYSPSGIGEPWLMVPMNEDRTDWRIIDQRSMESLLLSEELGGPLPESYQPSGGGVAGTDVLVVTWRAENPYPVATPDGVPALDRTALVLPGSIEDRHWIDIASYQATGPREFGSSQVSSVKSDGSLLAYTTLTDTFAPVIRVEDAVSGEQLVDVPIDEIDADTRFILAGADDSYLVVANGDTVRILGMAPDATREIAEMPGPDVESFLPTANPDIVLMSHNYGGTAITPINVTTGTSTGGEFYNYVSPAWWQVYGDDELPSNLVRIVSDSLSGQPAIIQLVNLSTGEVVLESDPVDAHPIQIVSFNTYLRNGGTLAVVPIGYNRAVVLDAASGEVWQVEAPIDDDRLWRFFPGMNGQFISAYPEPPVGTSEIEDYHVAPMEPDAEWVPIEGGSNDQAMNGVSTPVG